MTVTVWPSELKGIVSAPPSKSVMQRFCAAALIRRGQTTIIRPGNSEDDSATLSILEALGCSIKRSSDFLLIDSTHIHADKGPMISVSCGESGLASRLFPPILGLFDLKVKFTGSGSLLKRDSKMLTTLLPKIMRFQSQDHHFPYVIQGGLTPENLSIDGRQGSQFLSGLLMAYSGANAKGVEISAEGLVSRPYVELTLDVMRRCGMKLPEYAPNLERFSFVRGDQSFHDTLELKVDGDWSNAAFLLVGAAIHGDVEIRDLTIGSFQADEAIIEVLKQADVDIQIRGGSIFVKTSAIRPFSFDATHCPDLFPPLTVLAAYATGISRIKGVHRLVNKESNRSEALQDMWQRLGLTVRIDPNEDTMMMVGKGEVIGGEVNAFNDHRIVMAASIAALRASNPIMINGAESVRKSWPDFFQNIGRLGLSSEESTLSV